MAEWSSEELVSSSLSGRRILCQDESEPQGAPTGVDREGDGLRAGPCDPFAEALVAGGVQGKAAGAAVGEQDPCLRRVNLLLGTSFPIARSWLGFSSLNHGPGCFWYFKSCA